MTGLTPSQEDRLRLALAMIGEAAVDSDTTPKRGPVWRRPRVVLAAAAVVTLVALGAGVWTLRPATQASVTAGAGHTTEGQTLEEWIACARMIAEGDVVAVRDSSEPSKVILDFAVRDWIKPRQGPREVVLSVFDPAFTGTSEPWEVGEHVLLVIPARRDREADSFRGTELAAYRDRINRALPAAAETECPPVWRDSRG